MSKRKLVWIVVALVGVLSAAGLLWSIFGKSELVFTESDLQGRLNQQLPRTVREVTIDRVTVRLAESRLTLRIELHGSVLRQAASAVVSARGIPRYEPGNGEMFFDADDVKIEQVTVAGRSVTGSAAAAVERLAETAIKAYSATRPVYRFKDDFKGIVLKAALVNATIMQNMLVVTFSLWNLTVTVATFALMLIAVLFIIYLLLRHPFWGIEIGAGVADV